MGMIYFKNYTMNIRWDIARHSIHDNKYIYTTATNNSIDLWIVTSKNKLLRIYSWSERSNGNKLADTKVPSLP